MLVLYCIVKFLNCIYRIEKNVLKYCVIFFYKAMTQERRRYGFVLERQCSLVKHCLAYHTNTQSMYDEHLNDWLDVAKSRERLPESVETMFATKLRVNIKTYL